MAFFRTPRNGSRSWGSCARRRQLGHQGQQDSLPRGHGFSRLLLAPCWFGGGRVSSLSQLRSSTLPCPRRLVSGDVHPPRSDAVQTALGTSPLLSQPVSSCVKLTAMTLAVVFLNLSEPGAEPGPRATALLAQRYGVVRTQGWPTWVHFLALLLPCLAV